MNSGDFRNLVTIENPIETQLADGSYGETWVTHKTVWASIEPLSGKEMVESGGIEFSYSHRIRMRFVPGVTNKMRVKYIDNSTSPATTRYFGIVHPRPVEFRSRELQLTCEERSYEQ